MQYRTDARSGNQLSVLGFGCMRLPRTISGIDMKSSEEIVMRAIENGVNYFDVAHIYPGSEVALGKILADNGVRDKVCIATKLPLAACKKSEDFDRFFGIQLDRLQTNYVDYYLMHNINTLRQWQKLCDIGIESWIKQKKAEGSIRQIGFSFHGTCGEFLKLLDAYDWDFCQIQYNYSDENYQAGVTGLRRAAEKNIPVIIMEPLLGGKLAGGLPKKAVGVFRRIDSALSPAAWALRWLLDQPEATVLLSGMNSDEQLQDNLRTVNTGAVGMLTEREKQAYSEVVKIFRDAYKVDCTGCGYCMPCPHGVNIPECFAGYNASYVMGRIAGFKMYTMGTGATRKENHRVVHCNECGKCEKQCPQHIEIRERLKDVERHMEPFYFRWGVAMLRGFVK